LTAVKTLAPRTGGGGIISVHKNPLRKGDSKWRFC
jgi:hypothetical protein